jgi:hypothetical protein
MMEKGGAKPSRPDARLAPLGCRMPLATRAAMGPAMTARPRLHGVRGAVWPISALDARLAR